MRINMVVNDYIHENIRKCAAAYGLCIKDYLRMFLTRTHDETSFNLRMNYDPWLCPQIPPSAADHTISPSPTHYNPLP